MIESKLHKIIDYAYNNSQYYQKTFKQKNINIDDFKIEDIPIITKEEYVKDYDSIICKTSEEVIHEYTSGSTGVPLLCEKTKSERVAAALAIWRRRKNIDSKVNSENYISVWRDNYLREIIMEVNEEKLRESLTYILRKNPRWLSGPVTILKMYARLIRNKKVEYNRKIKYIELMGEYASKEDREYLEDIFKCKTVVLYGLREMWAIAFECPCGNLHILDEQVYVEVLDKNNKKTEEIGNIVVTSLYNKKMPFIRYNTYDIGQIINEKCSCGCDAPILQLSGGRVMDVIKGKELIGSIILGRISSHMVRDYPNYVETFKVVQVELNKLIFYIIPGSAYEDSILTELTELIHKHIGADMLVEYLLVNNIPISKNGKSKVFECII